MHGWSKSAKIPVKFVNGQLRLLNGDPLPGLKENQAFDIILPATSFENDADRMRFTLKQSVILFPPSMELWITFNPAGCILEKFLKGNELDIRRDMPSGWIGTKVITIHPLSMQIQGIYGGTMEQCGVSIPILGTEVGTLNQAYTDLSQAFEPRRISHVGNVFRRIWYSENGGWYQLEEKRKETLSKVEEQFPEWYEQNQHRCVQSSIGELWLND